MDRYPAARPERRWIDIPLNDVAGGGDGRQNATAAEHRAWF